MVNLKSVHSEDEGSFNRIRKSWVQQVTSDQRALLSKLSSDKRMQAYKRIDSAVRNEYISKLSSIRERVEVEDSFEYKKIKGIQVFPNQYVVDIDSVLVEAAVTVLNNLQDILQLGAAQ